MVRLMKDLLAQRERETFVGRRTELETRAGSFEDGPRVIFLHGIAGVGKSALLSVFSEQARANGAAVISLDCRAIEPTERGLLQQLGTAIGGRVTGAEQASLRLQSLGSRVLLSLVHSDVVRLVESWLMIVCY